MLILTGLIFYQWETSDWPLNPSDTTLVMSWCSGMTKCSKIIWYLPVPDLLSANSPRSIGSFQRKIIFGDNHLGTEPGLVIVSRPFEWTELGDIKLFKRLNASWIHTSNSNLGIYVLNSPLRSYIFISFFYSANPGSQKTPT